MMKCNVIQDLMMLYADGCCSEDSKAIVEEHVKSCESCKKAFEELSAPIDAAGKAYVKKADFPRISIWKASVMQSVLLFFSFAVLAFSVAREAATPTGDSNGLWAIAVIIPVTGFLLSLANWYFLRVYPDRKSFSGGSLLATAVFILIGYVWAALHYRPWDSANISSLTVAMAVTGCALSVALCAVSKVLSLKYARMNGKE